MNTLTFRVTLSALLLIPSGALLLSKAWSQPDSVITPTPTSRPVTQNDLQARLQGMRIAPAHKPIDLRKSPDEIYRTLQQYDAGKDSATTFSIALPTLSPSRRYLDTSTFTITKMWRKAQSGWVISKDKSLLKKASESGSFVSANTALRSEKWFSDGRAFSPREGI